MTGGHTSLNDTYPTNNQRLVTSSKSKRSGQKQKYIQDPKDFSISENINRIYTPQNFLNLERKLGRKLQKKGSNNNTLVSNEVEFKSSGEPVNISNNKESNHSLNMTGNRHKHRFRVASAHANYFNRLQSANKLKQTTLLNKTKLTTFSVKDWEVMPVQSDIHTVDKPVRS